MAAWRRSLRWRWFTGSHPLRRHECGLIADWGIGDHLVVMAFAPAVAAQYGLAVRWIAGKPRYRALRELFDGSFGYAPWEVGDGAVVRAMPLEPGGFYYAHFPDLSLAHRIGRDGFHLLDAYRTRLGLPADAALAPRRQPSPAELKAAESVLAGADLPPGRTVLLAIDAGTTPTGGDLTPSWLALASALRERGWTPVVNQGPRTPALPGVRSLPMPLRSVRALAVCAGAVVSVRSGLSDLTCDIACPRAVLYPDLAWFGGTLRDGSTFERYGLEQPPLEVTLPFAGDAGIRILADHLTGA